MREALKILPPEQLRVLEPSYFSGHTHAEIADLLGLWLSTVKNRLRLVMKKKKDHFVVRGQAARCAAPRRYGEVPVSGVGVPFSVRTRRSSERMPKRSVR